MNQQTTPFFFVTIATTTLAVSALGCEPPPMPAMPGVQAPQVSAPGLPAFTLPGAMAWW